MTDRRFPASDQFLVTWFEDGPTTMPDRVIDVVADRIGRQRQRRARRLLGRPFMNSYAKLGLAAAAILIVAVVGYSILPRTPTGPGGVPTPIPTPTSSAAAAVPSPTPPQCEDLIPGCAGPLQAGQHTTGQFEPTFAYTTPAGWINSIDIPTLMTLTTSFDLPDPILVWSNVVPADRGADCVLKPKAGASATVDGWTTYLTSHPGLVVSNQHETTLNGLRAVVADLQSNLAWATPCADDAPGHNVPIIHNVGNTPGDGYGTGADGRVRVYIVGVGSTTVLVTIYSYGGGDATFASMLPTVEPIVQSFRFAVPDSPSPSGG